MKKKEREIREFELDFEKSLCSVFMNDDIVLVSSLRPGLKTGVKNDTFWSERGSGFEEAGGTPPSRIPRSTPTSKMLTRQNKQRSQHSL